MLVERRQDRDRDGVDIGNDAEQVAQIKRARLYRNVGSRIVQPEERSDAGPGGFRHHFAGTAFVETVDHDPIEAGERPRLSCAFAEESFQCFRVIEAGHHAAHGERRSVVPVFLAALAFDDDLTFVQMHGKVEPVLIGRQSNAENTLDDVGTAQRGKFVADCVECFGADQRDNGTAERIGLCHSEKLRQICGGADDNPV
ncbi:hypothetical protein ACVIOG_002325 [Rhizobium leguminosarum]